MLDEREELLLSVTLARKVVEEANAKQNVLSMFLLARAESLQWGETEKILH